MTGRPIDIAGERFGKLLAVTPTTVDGMRSWHCQCDCGGSIDVPTFQLTGGYVVRCDSKWHTVGLEKGAKFGRLTIKDFVRASERPDYVKGKRGLRGYYLCDCFCGNTGVKVFPRNLQRGKTNCGCIKKVMPRKPAEDVLTNKMFHSYQTNAQNKGRVFELTKEQFISIIFSPCHYCNEYDERKLNYREDIVLCCGVDRLSSDEGYTTSNVVSCCMDCNYLKVDRTYVDFLNKIEKIYKNRNKLILEVERN